MPYETLNGGHSMTKIISYTVSLILSVLLLLDWVVDLRGESPVSMRTHDILAIGTLLAWNITGAVFLRELVKKAIDGVAVEIATMAREAQQQHQRVSERTGAQGPPGPRGPRGLPTLPGWFFHRAQQRGDGER